MANEDFVVRFGSNAATFKDQLKRDIVEVNGLVSQLRTALQQGANLKIAADGKLLRGPGSDPTIPQGGGRRGSSSGGSDPHYDAAVGRLVDNLETYTQTLGGVIRSMDGAAQLIQAAARATANRTTGLNRSEAAADREARSPGQSNLPNVRKVHEDALKAALDGADAVKDQDPFANGGNIRNVPRVEIDAAQLDRIAQSTKTGADAQVATNRKMDHLIGLINKGITVRWDGSGPPPGGGGRPPGGPPPGGGGGGGGRPPGIPAEPKGTPDLQQDAFSRVAQIRRFIQKRERETALFKELARLDKGEGAAPSGAALQTLSAGSKSFNKVFEQTGGQGPEYRARVVKAIESTRSELADVPRLRALRTQLNAAIAETGTSDGRLTREQFKERAAQRQKADVAPGRSTSGGHLKQNNADADRNTKLQAQATEALAIVKGYEVVVAGLSEAIADVEAGRKKAPEGIDLKAKLAKAQQDLAEAQRQLNAAKARAAGTSRADIKQMNRSAAAEQRAAAGPQMSGRAAQDRLDFMDIAGSTDAMRGRTVKQLRELAGVFRSEGYDVKVPRGANKDQLANILNEVHQKFEASGRATNSNLEDRAYKHQATEISPRARQIIGDLMGKVSKTEDQRRNDDVKSEAFQGGYSGLDKGRRGKTDVAYPVRNNRAEIDAAEESQQQRLARIAREATKSARQQLLADPKFDPYAPDVEVKGGGQQAGDARFALRAIRAVTDRLDKLGQAALRAHNDLDAMDKRLKALATMEAKANQFAGKNNLTADQAKQYTGLLADIKTMKGRVAADETRRPELQNQLDTFYKKARQDRVTLANGERVAGLGMAVPDRFFAQENFGVGYDARKKSKFDAETLRMQRAEAAADNLKKAQSSSQDIQAAVLDTLFGRRNALNSQGQVSSGIMRTGMSRTVKRVDQVSTLPDIFNDQGIRRDFPNLNEADLVAARKATNKYAGSIKRARRMEQENRLAEQSGTALPHDTAALERQAAHVGDRLAQVFKAVEKITGPGVTGGGKRDEAAQAALAKNVEALRERPKSNVDRSELVALDRLLAKGALNTSEIAQALGLSKTTRPDPNKINDNFLKAAEARERAQTRLQAFDSNPEAYAARERAAAAAKAARFAGSDIIGADKVAADAKARANITTAALRAEIVESVSAATQAVREATTTTAVQGLGPDSERQAREALTTRRAQVARQVADAEAAEAKARAATTSQLQQAANKKVTSGDPSSAFRRAEAIIAGGAATRDMGMVKGRLAKQAGLDYQSVKGEYEGVEGLRRLLDRARGGAAGTQAAAEVKDAVAKGKQGGFDDDCCTKIVAGLNRIVEALRGGIRFTGPNGQETTGATAGPRVAGQRGRNTGATTPEEREARKKRIREEFALAETRGQRRLDRARAQEQSAVTTQTMKEAAATAELAKTLSQLDAVTKGHIERLRQQKAAGADATTQYRTMQDIYRTGAATLRQRNPSEGVGRRSERLGGVISDAVGTQVPQRDIRRMGADIENELSNSIRQAAEGNAGNRGPLAEALFGGKGFMSRVLNSTGTFLVRNFTAGFVFGMTNALQDVIQQALETEATFIRISSALEATGRSSGTLRTGLQQISTDYGVALKDVYTTAAGLTGVFASNEELEAGTRIAAQLESISRGALNSTEAMKALASVTTAFGDDLSGAEGLQTGIDGLTHVADVLTVIQDRMGVNIEDTVEGVGRLAGQAKQLGFNFEEVAVYVAAVSKLTNQTGQAAGEQLSRIFSQLQSGPGQAALIKNLGPSSGIGEALGTRDYAATMDILLEKYNELGKAEKDQIALALGGARQAAAINALLEQGAQVRDTVAAATDASGQADKRAAEIAETLNNQVKRLQTNFQNLGSAIVRSGFLNALGAILVITNEVLGGFNMILSLVNDFADSNPITRWARDVGLGFLGALGAIKLLTVGIRALKGAMATAGFTSGGSAAAARVAAAAGGVPFIPPAGGAPGAPGGGAAAGRNIRFLPYLNPFRGFGTSYDERRVSNGLFSRSQANRMVSDGRGGFVPATALYTGSGSVSTRLMQGAGVRSSRFASNISQLGQRMAATAAPTMTGFARQQAGRALMGPVTRGANTMGRAFTSLGSVLQRSALAAAAASAAMSALALALGAVIIDAVRARQFRKDLKTAFDADVNNETEEGRAEKDRYANRYGELVKKNNESNENFFGMGGVRSLARGVKNIASALTPFADFGEDSAEAVGDYTGEKLRDGRDIDQAIFNQMQTSFGRIRDVNTRSKALRADATTKGTLLAPETQDGINAMKAELEEASKVSAEEIEKLKNDIMSSDMSDAQKAGALAQLQDIQEAVSNSGAKARLTIMGLNNLNVIGGQQLDMLTSLMSSVASGGASTGEFADLITRMATDIGLQEGSDYLANTKGLATEKTSVGRMELMRENERLTLQMLEAKLADDNLDPQMREDLTKQAQAALGRYEQLQVGVLQAHIAGANAIAAELRANGDFAGSAAALQGALDALDVELERYKDDPYQTAILQAQRRQVVFSGTETRLEPTIMAEQEARSRGRDQVGNAGSETREALAVLEAYEAEGSGATAKQISDARVRYNNALKAEADAINNRNQAQLQQQIAGTLNAAARATLEEALALSQVSFARDNFGEASAEYAQAMGRYLQSQEASFQATEAERAASAQTGILRIAPGDTQAIAAARLREAERARQVATRYGRTSTQYQQADQAVLQAQREVTNAIYDMAAADAELQIALAEAAGDRVGVARHQAREAERLYQQALAQAGGNTSAPSVTRANASRVRANAAERDAILNDQISTIDFQREMGEITANTAISMLTELLKQTNLTEEQRRQLRLKIKGLQADIRNTLTASGFNIPDQIKLPTAYEVRRSLGVDAYVAAGDAALKDLQNMSVQSAMGSLTMSSSSTPTAATTTVVNNNNTPVTVNNTVSTPAMVEAVARRVVELISTQTNMGARANQTSPALVRY